MHDAPTANLDPPGQPLVTRLLSPLVMTCFLLSGLTGLLYQTLWGRTLGLFLGHSSYAHTVVLATFMGGLALGNHLFGRRVDKARRPLQWYAWLEIGIGALAALFLVGFPALTTVYVGIGAELGPESGWILPLKVVLSVLSILAPTTLMGGTLPVLGKALISNEESIGSGVGRLYFINTAGAIVGCYLGGFTLVEAVGVPSAMGLAAATNIGIGLVLLVVERTLPGTRGDVDEDDLEEEEEEEGDEEVGEAASAGEEPRAEMARAEVEGVVEAAAVVAEPAHTPREVRFTLVAIGLGGALSMLYELVWTRLVAFVFGSSSQSFSVMLMTFITGIALGGGLSAKLLTKRRDAVRWFAMCEFGVAASILAMLPLYERFPYAFAVIRQLVAPNDGGFAIMQTLQIGLLFSAMLVPTTLIGMTLPLATRIVVERLDHVGEGIGSTFSVNTVGTLIGAALTGLVVLPALGLQATLYLGVVGSAGVGVLLVWAHRGSSPRWTAVTAAVTVVTIALAIVWIGRWDTVLLTAGYFRGKEPPVSFEAMKSRYARHMLLFNKDGVDTTVTVIKVDDQRFLKVNGKTDASTHPLDMRTQIISGHLPLLLHPGEPKEILVIGLGSGITVGTTLLYPETRTRAVEISDAVVEGARLFGPENRYMHDNPRMTMVVGDAKDYLLLEDKTRWDVIISEPSNPWISGIASLFSVDFFSAIHDRLADDGIYLQWMQLYSFNDETLSRSLNSVRAAFPYVTLFRFSNPDCLIVASRQPLRPDPARIDRLLALPGIGEDLRPGRPVVIHSALELLAHQVLSDEVVSAAFPARPPLNTDDHPWLEFEAPRAMFRQDKPTLIDGLDERQRPLSRCRLPLCRILAANPPSELQRQRIADALEGAGRVDLARTIKQVIEPRTVDELTREAVLHDDTDLQVALRVSELLASDAPIDDESCDLYVPHLAHLARRRTTFLTEPDTQPLEDLIVRCSRGRPIAATAFLAELADVFYNAGWLDDAIDTAEDAIDDAPVGTDRGALLSLLRTLGRAALEQGNKPKADRAFTAIRRFIPRDREARAYFGR